jgi:hypothetical protein
MYKVRLRLTDRKAPKVPTKGDFVADRKAPGSAKATASPIAHGADQRHRPKVRLLQSATQSPCRLADQNRNILLYYND